MTAGKQTEAALKLERDMRKILHVFAIVTGISRTETQQHAAGTLKQNLKKQATQTWGINHPAQNQILLVSLLESFKGGSTQQIFQTTGRNGHNHFCGGLIVAPTGFQQIIHKPKLLRMNKMHQCMMQHQGRSIQ